MKPVKWTVVTDDPYFATATIDVAVIETTSIQAHISIQQTINGARYASTLSMNVEETSLSLRDVSDSIEEAEDFLNFVCSSIVEHGTVILGIKTGLGEPS